jgi:rhodanese-related sulfurtransferase
MPFNRSVLAFAAAFLVAGSAVAALWWRGPPPRRVKFTVSAPASARVSATDLASWIIEGRRDFAVIDLRGDAAFEAGHVKDAVHCGSCHEDRAAGEQALHAMEDHFVDLSKKLVLYTQTGRETVELPRLLAQNPRLLVLDGGYDAWRAEVLAPVAIGGEQGEGAEALIEARKKRQAVRAFFTGERPASAGPAQLPVTPIRRDTAHQPAAAHEGC